MRSFLFTAAAVSAVAFATPAQAVECIGACGTLGANGVVTAPPNGSTYGFVTTNGGVGGAGQIAGVGGTNGSRLTSDAFSGMAGDTLSFYFNFVTSDGAGFSDYAWAELVDGSLAHVAWLFTGRTRPTGDTSPGFGLPTNDAVLVPATSPIIGGGPVWAPLGSDSGRCFSAGCGYTGWIQSTYSLTAGGTYSVRFGVTNVSDQQFDTGLAFSGLALNDTSVGNLPGAVPEPSTWAMMMLGFGAIGAAARRRTRVRFATA